MPVNRSMASTEIDGRLDAYFSQLARDEVFSGVALVAKRRRAGVLQGLWHGRSREEGPEQHRQTRFNIGSINKAFTNIAIQLLIADGKLSIADTLGKFFPDYPQAVSRTATVASC